MGHVVRLGHLVSPEQWEMKACQEIAVGTAKQEEKDILVSLVFLGKAVNQGELENQVLLVEKEYVASKDLSGRKENLDRKGKKVQQDILDAMGNVETTERLDHLGLLVRWECLANRANKAFLVHLDNLAQTDRTVNVQSEV